jgi:arylsulfatase A-like enzyme
VHTGRVGNNEEFDVPEQYLNTCLKKSGASSSGYEQYVCALLIMMDEAIGQTACLVEEHLNDRDYLIVVASDNGGWGQIPGSNFPHKGAKGSMGQGGIHNPAFIFGSKVPTQARGSTYDGLVHMTDWMPTFMSLASQGKWTKPKNGFEAKKIRIFISYIYLYVM